MDISKCFDSIPHRKLMNCVKKRIGDKNILRLINGWLKAGVMESGMEVRNEIGIQQGGVISPLLANIYLNELDREWTEKRMDIKRDAHLIRYADDIIILTTGRVEETYQVVREILKNRLSLTVNEGKSKIVDATKESFTFLGFGFKWVRNWKGKGYVLRFPSNKAMKSIYSKVRRILNPRIPVKIEEVIPELNLVLNGWVNYFRIGNASKWFSKLRYYTERKVRRFIRRKQLKRGFGWNSIGETDLYGKLGLYNCYYVSWRRA